MPCATIMTIRSCYHTFICLIAVIGVCSTLQCVKMSYRVEEIQIKIFFGGIFLSSLFSSLLKQTYNYIIIYIYIYHIYHGCLWCIFRENIWHIIWPAIWYRSSKCVTLCFSDISYVTDRNCHRKIKGFNRNISLSVQELQPFLIHRFRGSQVTGQLIVIPWRIDQIQGVQLIPVVQFAFSNFAFFGTLNRLSKELWIHAKKVSWAEKPNYIDHT